jgi:cytochrome bd-type quinol oxidase subunit 2
MSISVAVFLAIITISVWKPTAIQNRNSFKWAIFSLVGRLAAVATAHGLAASGQPEGGLFFSIVAQIASAISMAVLIFSIVPWALPSQFSSRDDETIRD